MVDRNKFVKRDYVVTATTKNPVYNCGRYSWIVLAIFVIAVTCFNF